RLGQRPRPPPGTLEPRADRRPVPPRAPPPDQSRNHLSAHLGRQASRRQLAHPPARRPEAVPQTLPALRQPRPARRQTADHGAPHDRRGPRPDRGLGSRPPPPAGRDSPLGVELSGTEARLSLPGPAPRPDRGRGEPARSAPAPPAAPPRAYPHLR